MKSDPFLFGFIGFLVGAVIGIWLCANADVDHKEWARCQAQRPAFVSDSAFLSILPSCARWRVAK